MLKGKSVIVTGSTSGIGLGVARAFAAQGCNVMLNGFGDGVQIEKLRAAIAAEHKVTVLYSSADMAKALEVSAMVDQVARRFGSVDVLVNNAGIQHVAPVEEFPVEKWDQILAINLSSAFHSIRAALPGMKSRNWGRIINVASAHGLVASPFKSAYVAAKHGLVGLTKAVALDYAPRKVRVNAVCPGSVRDDEAMEGRMLAEIARSLEVPVAEHEETFVRAQPMNALVEPQDVADAALWLASDESRQVTGSVLTVDGGFTTR
ncbi:MAG TPA: 3-hydroxybutyrate dehydrogenase [Streptomyces sp.]|nr:3-hydroxybutyrate dehydrogenase [Streptomyces sp.]